MNVLLSAIAAMSTNRVIGRENQLPWRLPADLRHFKTLTTGQVILMGRKTYESIGRPLLNRTNLVLTRNRGFRAEGIETVASLEEAKARAAALGHHELMIIGGADLYQQTLPLVQKLYITLIREEIEGDAYFPAWNPAEWEETERQDHLADAENPYAFSFVTLLRR